MKTLASKLLWLLAVVLVLGGGGYWWTHRQAQQTQSKLETAPVVKGNIRSRVTATGNLQAVTQITVGSQVSGIVQQLFVDFNSRVRKGQPLAQIDPATFEAQLEQTTASVNNAQSQLHNAEANVGNQAANVRSAEAAVSSAQAKVEAALGNLANSQAAVTTAEANLRKGQADLTLAQRNEERQALLKERELISAADLDTARTTTLTTRATVDSLRAQIEAARAGLRSAQANVRSAQAEVEAARMRVQAAQQQYQSARAQVQGARAQVSQAQANQSQARTNLSFTTIRSPIDGIVLDRKVTLGQTVAAQFQAPDLFTLAENLDQIQVQTNIDEADIGQIKEGAQVTFTVDAYAEERFRGKVKEIRQSPVTVQNVVTYVVIVDTRNDEGKLKPGMTATVNIQVASREDVLLVPNAALRFRPPQPPAASSRNRSGSRPPGGNGERKREPRKSSLWTVDPRDPNKFVEHKVVTGITDGSDTELVETDLKEGDLVVVSTGSATTSPSNGNSRSTRGPRLF